MKRIRKLTKFERKRLSFGLAQRIREEYSCNLLLLESHIERWVDDFYADFKKQGEMR